MDGRSLSRVFLVFCILCSPLWGVRLGEDPADYLGSLEETMLHTVATWEAYEPNLLKTRIKEGIQSERNPLLPDELKIWGWEHIQGLLRDAIESFQRSIEEAGSLMRLIQLVKLTPRPEGRLDFYSNTHLVEAELKHLVDTMPRVQHSDETIDDAE
jgi:hypothetical protein